MNHYENTDALPAFSVSDVNRIIKSGVESNPALAGVIVGGEISNLSNHYRTGHLYFSLKDESSQLKAVMFARDAQSLAFSPENGMSVLAFGKVGVFERDGIYQLYVRRMQPDGAGALALAFEQLKKKLASEGLFDEDRKKALPQYPRRIGVITSPTGAAVRDIFSILGRRYPLAEIVFQPVSVQGSGAARELREAVERFSALNNVDTLIIGRGGGSAEDLWCFNDELLARAIADCPIPVISAVGHETDFTICDFVADVRAATPSAAAELAVPDTEGLRYGLSELTERLYKAYAKELQFRRARLDGLLARRDFSDPGKFFDSEKRAVSALSEKLGFLRSDFISSRTHALAVLTEKLAALNPLDVLLRGYGAVESGGRILVGVDPINVGDEVKVSLSDGAIICEVKEKWKK